MLDMPLPDQAVLKRQSEIATALKAIIPDGVIGDHATLTAYDGDALTAYRQRPLLAVLPQTPDQVSKVLKFAARENIKIVPRGAACSIAGRLRGFCLMAVAAAASDRESGRYFEVQPMNESAIKNPRVLKCPCMQPRASL